MIMTSYYYSVSGLLCLLIYGIYKYIKQTKKVTIKSFFVDGIKFLCPMFIGILMASILLVPTVFAILSSRSQIKNTVDLLSLFIPRFNFNTMLYDNYGMGFTAISVIALIYTVFVLKEIKDFESMFISTFSIPLFMYILNGMLYLRAKVFIPISPLIIFLVALLLDDLKNKRVNIIDYIKVVIVILIMALIFKYNNEYFYTDLLLTSLGIILIIIKRTKLLYVILIVISLVSNIPKI